MKALLRSLAFLVGLSAIAQAAPVPAVNYIRNQSRAQTGAVFNVSSGTVNGQLSVDSIKWPNGTVQRSSPTAGGSTTVLTSSAVAFGSSISTVTSDVANFYYVPSLSLTVPGLNIYSSVFGLATQTLNFGNFGTDWTISATNGSGVCSDLSVGCSTTPMSFIFGSTTTLQLNADGRVRMGPGNSQQKNATAYVRGSLLIGTGYSDLGSMPADGLRVMGQAIFHSTLTIVNQALSVNGSTYTFPSGLPSTTQYVQVTSTGGVTYSTGTGGSGSSGGASTSSTNTWTADQNLKGLSVSSGIVANSSAGLLYQQFISSGAGVSPSWQWGRMIQQVFCSSAGATTTTTSSTFQRDVTDCTITPKVLGSSITITLYRNIRTDNGALTTNVVTMKRDDGTSVTDIGKNSQPIIFNNVGLAGVVDLSWSINYYDVVSSSGIAQKYIPYFRSTDNTTTVRMGWAMDNAIIILGEWK